MHERVRERGVTLAPFVEGVPHHAEVSGNLGVAESYCSGLDDSFTEFGFEFGRPSGWVRAVGLFEKPSSFVVWLVLVPAGVWHCHSGADPLFWCFAQVLGGGWCCFSSIDSC